MQVAPVIRRASSNAWTIGWLSLIALSVVVVMRDFAGDAGSDVQRQGRARAADLTAVNLTEPQPLAGATIEPKPKYAVEIRRPAGPPVIELQQPDPLGRVGRLSCSTCHSVRPPSPAVTSAADLKEFHQGLPLNHGSLTCYACHNPADMDRLRRADGAEIEYRDVMTLCAQCHGAQARDYEQYLHGGMTGYWDLTRGARLRNNCIDCHDPHAPQFPRMQPTFKPRDRFVKSLPDDQRQHAPQPEQPQPEHPQPEQKRPNGE